MSKIVGIVALALLFLCIIAPIAHRGRLILKATQPPVAQFTFTPKNL